MKPGTRVYRPNVIHIDLPNKMCVVEQQLGVVADDGIAEFHAAPNVAIPLDETQMEMLGEALAELETIAAKKLGDSLVLYIPPAPKAVETPATTEKK
jgi:hypothetical protein